MELIMVQIKRINLKTRIIYKLMLITKSHFINAEKKSCPNLWFDANDLQPNKAVLGCYL